MFDFRDVKAGELTRHVQHCETVVATATVATELQAIEEEIGRITQELSLLATFTRLNYTSFAKILKKHDKRTDFMLRPTFMLRLNSKPLYLENLDSLIYRLSKLYDKIRHRLSGSAEEPAGMQQLSSAQTFVRKTSKYWVHGENVTPVKCLVLKYLPVLVFPTKIRKIDLAVSSVYLDNDALDLYRGRLEKTEGAEAIRIRWYGSDDPQEVYVERKVHREDWTGEVSVKTRFLLKEKHVADYLAGTYTADDLVAKLRKDPRHRPEDVDAMGTLAHEIQAAVLARGLKPKVRTFYNRTAFQLPADARVRISLDTELSMIREDGPHRAGRNWRRTDIGTTDFDELSSKEIYRFPHAVLEVKLQTQAGQEAPQWVDRLITGPLVEEVPKFSKYIHGTAALFPSLTTVVPYWFGQMATDIRKTSPNTPSSDESQSETDAEVRRSTSHILLQMDPEDSSEATSPLLPSNPARLLPSNAATPVPSSAANPVLSGAANPVLSSAANRPRALQQGDKRIQVPVRVEPKVFFANERTFLSWIHFAIFLGGISTALVGFGNSHARASGYLFAGVSVIFTLYALYLYHWRAERIRLRDPGPYDDRLGPNFVAIVFVLAMVANVLFTSGASP